MSGVDIIAGLDAEQVRAAWVLHDEWALEEHGAGADAEGWWRTAYGLASGGLWNLVIAWDGETPVAVVELYLHYDPLSRALVGHGDRAFVRAGYRGQGLFGRLVDAMEALGTTLGATKFLVPASAGSPLVGFYERRGYEVTGVTLRKEVG